MIKIKPNDLKAMSFVLMIAFVILAAWLVLTFSELNRIKTEFDSSAEGTVVSERYVTGASGKDGMYRLEAEFEANGAVHITTFTDKDSFRIRKGDTVTVLYDSNDPDNNAVVDKLEHQALTIAIFTSVCLLCAAASLIAGIRWSKKIKDPEEL